MDIILVRSKTGHVANVEPVNYETVVVHLEQRVSYEPKALINRTTRNASRYLPISEPDFKSVAGFMVDLTVGFVLGFVFPTQTTMFKAC